MKEQHFDVIIVGAGVSGVGAGCHLTMNAKKKNFAILERRKDMGGTWDLFRYPGIRSDSDMYTFGYAFRPWQGTKVLADGPAIKQYVIDTAKEYGVDKKIRFGRKVVHSSWSTERGLWTINVLNEETDKEEVYTADFIINASGYYNYDKGYKPEFAGEKSFKGDIIHPQHWPKDLDYSGKKVVIIGSGATAITLVPAMAGKAEHVTMLQRSPTYIVSIPSNDEMSAGMNRFLPKGIVYLIARARNIFMQRFFFWIAQQRPSAIRRLILQGVKKHMGENFDMKHFTPNYNPWEQRICVVPDGDLFNVVRDGQASIVTEHIDTFTEKGIKLKNGQELEADIIVTATGLDVRLLGGCTVDIDGEMLDVGTKLTYKGVLAQDVPNAAIIFGYTNASWTLKVDIACEYLCRLFNYMDGKGYTYVIPKDYEGCATDESVMGLASGYLQRAKKRMPKQGTKAPWRVNNDYMGDVPVLKFAPINDGILEFAKPSELKQRTPLKVLQPTGS